MPVLARGVEAVTLAHPLYLNVSAPREFDELYLRAFLVAAEELQKSEPLLRVINNVCRPHLDDRLSQLLLSPGPTKGELTFRGDRLLLDYDPCGTLPVTPLGPLELVELLSQGVVTIGCGEETHCLGLNLYQLDDSRQYTYSFERFRDGTLCIVPFVRAEIIDQGLPQAVLVNNI